MSALPKIVTEAWDHRDGPVILTTVDPNGNPNSIYATCVARFEEDGVVIADNYFDKTRKNIVAGTKGSVLFMSSDGKAFQLKGFVEYHKDGAVYDEMKSWNPEKHPGHAAALLRVEEVFSGSERLI